MGTYFTNYRVLDEKGLVLFASTSPACFTEFTGGGFSGKTWSDYKSDRSMEVFYPFKDIEPILSLNNWWLKVMGEDFKCPITYTVIDYDIKDQAKYPGPMFSKGSQKYICWNIDYSQFNSKNHIKLALYLLRYMYEDNMSHMLNRMKEAYDAGLEKDTWRLFKWVSATDNSPKTAYRHSVFYYPVKLNWDGKEYIQNKVAGYKGSPFSGSVIDNIAAESRLVKGSAYDPYRDKSGDVIRGMNFLDYKKLINPEIKTTC